MCETSLQALWAADHSSWEKEYTKTMEEAGFVTGLATVCIFFHKEKNIRVVEHIDDFIIEGAEYDLRWVEATLRKKYIVKVRAILGPERTDDKVADILNRVVEWKDEELWYEADPRHVEKMLNDMELERFKESVEPGPRPLSKRMTTSSLTWSPRRGTGPSSRVGISWSRIDRTPGTA